MLSGKKSVALKGKYDIRAILKEGPLNKLSIDEVMDNVNITAAIIDTYTLVLQNCESVNLYDFTNDTLEVPEVIIRMCERVIFPTVVKSKMVSITNSTIHVEEPKKLHISGDLILTDSIFTGGGEVIVNGTVYADDVSYTKIPEWNIRYNKLVDVGSTNRIQT
jgi:hypothetical protein